MLTIEKVNRIFAERRKKQNKIEKEIDAAIDSKDYDKVQESLSKLVSACTEPINFNL